jgi:hypothetical protein
MPNCLLLLRLRVVVVSVEEKAGKTCQVRNTETNASEPLMKHRKVISDVETVAVSRARDSARQVPDDVPSDIRCIGGVTVFQARTRNVGTCCLDAKGADQAGNTREVLSTEARRRGGVTRSSDEAAVMAVERRGHVIGPWTLRQP